MNAIVIFFSRADENYFGGSMKYVKVGNTEIAVQHITELTGYDSFKLEMVQPYSADYMTCIEEAKAHLREKARPELKEMPDVSGYDTIILAYSESNCIGFLRSDPRLNVWKQLLRLFFEGNGKELVTGSPVVNKGQKCVNFRDTLVKILL